MTVEIRAPGRNTLIDGLRAVAVFCVLLHHWTNWGFQFGFGQIGVQTFFVISGFLITAILLTARSRAESSTRSALFEIRSFFIRRTLRIFPIYYLLLGFIFLVDRFGIRESIYWHALYMSNIYFFIKGEFEGSLSHLWTLSVEEQFYLVWPWMALFTPKRWLPFGICFLIVLAPTTRALLYATGHHEYAQYNTLVCANFDSLGCGALLAWAHTSAQQLQRDLILRTVYIGALVSLMIVAISFLIGDKIITITLDQLALAVIVTAILQAMQLGGKHPIIGFLSWSPLVYFGQISYGIYLYHMFAPNIANLLRVPEFLKQGPIGFATMTAITLFVASVSWFVVERPVNSLKTLFPYFRTQAALIRGA